IRNTPSHRLPPSRRQPLLPLRLSIPLPSWPTPAGSVRPWCSASSLHPACTMHFVSAQVINAVHVVRAQPAAERSGDQRREGATECRPHHVRGVTREIG